MKSSLAVLAVGLAMALATPRLLKAPLINKNTTGFVTDMKATQDTNLLDQSDTTSRSLQDCVVKVEGDILIPCKQWQLQQSAPSDVSRVNRGAPFRPDNFNHLWPEGKIFYSYADNAFNPRAVRTIKRAIAEWERFTCLSFKFSKKRENRVVLQPRGGCSSYIGMIGGLQNLTLGCRDHASMLHELGHAIGLLHEHQRPDRASYVNINYENIPIEKYKQFNKYKWGQVDSSSLSYYDYDSIMHYGQNDFSKNGRMTIKTKLKGKQNRIGQKKGLSFGDVHAVSSMYGCADHCHITDWDCPRPGFVSKDCRCVCPGQPGQPIKHCYDYYGDMITRFRSKQIDDDTGRSHRG